MKRSLKFIENMIKL